MDMLYDPPSGHRYGFPKVYRPIEGETLEETLIRDGYPEKMAYGLGQRCRFIGGEETPTLHWDSVARRYVEHDTSPMETFGELPGYAAGKVRMPMNDNRGPYIGTLTGRFYPFDPKPEDVDIDHIAHSLAMSCRYTGACMRFYSTAEHSVHIAWWLLPRYGVMSALCGLLHDAPEALSGFGDTARPSKVKAPIIKQTEERIWFHAVSVAFGLPYEIPEEVHEADSRIIADEMRQNMREADPKYDNPLGVALRYWAPEEAKHQFLWMFRHLTKGRAAA